MNVATSPGARFNGIVESFGDSGSRFAPLWRRRGVVASVLFGVLGLTVLALLVIPTRYLASASVIVAEQDPNAPSASGAQAARTGDPADVKSQLLIVRSPRILRQAMAMPGFAEAVRREREGEGGNRSLLSRVFGGPATPSTSDEALLDYLQPRYNVGSVGRSRVISIAYQSPIPAVAKTLADDLTEAFLADQRDATSRSREEAAQWLWAEVKRLDAALHDDELRIQAFRRLKGLVRGANGPISSERLTTVSQQLLAAETARADALARLNEIKANGGRNAGDAPAVLASRAVGDIKQQLTLVTGQIANSSATLGVNHPALRALERQREDLQKRLGQEVAAVASSLRKSFAAADVLVASLRKEAEAAKTDVGRATDDEASIANMVRAAETKRGQYEALFKQASELETQRRVLVGGTRLVSLAELPTMPFFPKRVPFLAAGLFIGLVAGAAAAILAERLQPGAHRPADLNAQTGLPVLAELPVLKPSGRSRGEPGGLSAERASPCPLGVALRDAEADPALQAALRKLESAVTGGGEGRPRSILVASSRAGEGRSFTTLALAQGIAASGRSVLVIECDPRRPTFEAALQTDAAPGLAAVLGGRVTPDRAALRTAVRNLHAIPAGAASSQPMDDLIAAGLPALLTWARRYDVVLLDGPSCASGATAGLLAREVDGVLFCVRANRADAEETARSTRGLRGAGGRLIGVAMTMTIATVAGPAGRGGRRAAPDLSPRAS